MPIKSGNSSKIVGGNIKELMATGRPQKQAVAIALHNANKKRGGIAGGDTSKRQHFADGGFVNSSVPGRTDRIPTSVVADSYVIPADIISGLGQGNSLAGSHIMDMILKTGPYGTNLSQAHGRANFPQAPRAEQPYATGGKTHKAPVVIAGGEYIVHPVDVMRVGEGSMTRGHERLDAFVKKMRAHHIKTLKNLAPPKK